MSHYSNTPYLIFKSPGGAIKKIILSKERSSIGRAPHGDIFIDAPGIFPLHATIVRSLEDIFIISNNKNAFIKVNGNPTQRSSLLNKDTFFIEQFEFTFFKPQTESTNTIKDEDILTAFNLIELALTNSVEPLHDEEQSILTTENESDKVFKNKNTHISKLEPFINKNEHNVPKKEINVNKMPDNDDTRFLNNSFTSENNIENSSIIAEKANESPPIPNNALNNETKNFSDKKLTIISDNSFDEALWGALKTIDMEQKEIVYHLKEHLVVVSFDKTKLLFSLRTDGAYVTHLDGPEAIINDTKCKETMKINDKQNITICSTNFIFLRLNQK